MGRTNKRGGSYLPNAQELVSMGINPETGLPLRFGTNMNELKTKMKRFLRVIDEQTAVNRYKWTGIPCNITSQELERLIYYKGQLCFFYHEPTDEYYFMPYALQGGLDFYGRYKTIHPVPLSAGTQDEKKPEQKVLAEYLSNIALNVVYDEQEEDKETDTETSAVLLHDYTKQLSQTIIPRQELNDSILDVEAECLPYMRTSLIMSTGVSGIRVNDADQADSVFEAGRSIQKAAESGAPYIPIIGPMEFQELAATAPAKAEEFMLAMQSIDNLRLSGYGLDNGGIFQKKAHLLEKEAEKSASNTSLAYADGLAIRQKFCDIVNSIWDVNIWCEAVEDPQAELNEDIEQTSEEVEYEDSERGGETYE